MEIPKEIYTELTTRKRQLEEEFKELHERIDKNEYEQELISDVLEPLNKLYGELKEAGK